ncbi:MAG: hypothetical protein GC151_18995 [Betaproteobacteria bacterium]|nr:hypothetical protein [Betaproteobacteria bacterium]
MQARIDERLRILRHRLRLPAAVRLLILGLLVLGSLSARAHSGATLGFATVTVESPGEVRFSLSLAATALPPELAARMHAREGVAAMDTAPLVAAVRGKVRTSGDGHPCPIRAIGTAPPKPGREEITIVATFGCAADTRAYTLQDDLSDVFGRDFHTLAHVSAGATSQQFSFGWDARELTFSAGETSVARGAGSFFPLGIEHILTGYDHLLFLIALILRGGNLLQLLKIVTAFTLAHSVTLALAVLDVVSLPGPLVESVIALSIAYVAAENLLPKFAVARRWTVSFLFGLVHGFGFSSVLREIGLPKENLVLALLNFNLGVEAGQACAVLVALPLLFALRRTPWEPKVVTGISVAILLVGLALSVERLVAMF